MKRNYDLRLLERNYDVGDFVHTLDEASVKNLCIKLYSPWRGPGTIVKKFSSLLFRVKLRDAIMVFSFEP